MSYAHSYHALKTAPMPVPFALAPEPTCKFVSGKPADQAGAAPPPAPKQVAHMAPQLWNQPAAPTIENS